MSTRLQVPVAPTEERWLRHRADLDTHAGKASPARQAAVELQRWRLLLAAELRRIRLTLDEALFLGRLIGQQPHGRAEPGTEALVYTRAYEELTLPALGEPEQTNVDTGALLSYLHGLGPTADWALYQALADWAAAGAHPSIEALATVGLHVTSAPETVRTTRAERGQSSDSPPRPAP